MRDAPSLSFWVNESAPSLNRESCTLPALMSAMSAPSLIICVKNFSFMEMAL